MANSTKIIVAVGALYGGVLNKDKTRVPAELANGEELTEAKAAALGLDEAAIESLLERGALIEIDVRAAEAAGGDTAELEAELAAETKRADDAETKVKDLEVKLAAATKPPGQPA